MPERTLTDGPISVINRLTKINDAVFVLVYSFNIWKLGEVSIFLNPIKRNNSSPYFFEIKNPELSPAIFPKSAIPNTAGKLKYPWIPP